MATNNKKANEKVKEKINHGTLFMRNAVRPKDLMLWVPSTLDPSTPIAELVSYLQFAVNIPRSTLIETGIYEDDFDKFYVLEIQEKYDDTVKKGHYFCATDTMGGVNKDYIVDTANDPTTATLMSVKLNPNGSIDDVYALVTFKIVEKNSGNKAVKICTLCGNKSIPSTGEGSRLLGLIETVGYNLSYNKVILNPVDSAVKYYLDHKYRGVTELDSDELNSDSGSSGSSSNDGSGSDPDKNLVLQKNTKALRGWAKVRNAVKLNSMLRDRRDMNERLQLEQKYTEKENKIKEDREKSLDLVHLRTGERKHTIIKPGATFESNYKFVPKPKRGIPSKVIVPGASFTLSNKKAELSETANKTLKKQTDEILDRLKSEKAQQKASTKKKASKTKTGKGNKKTTRRRF